VAVTFPAGRDQGSWQRRIDRAAQLTAQDDATRPLLVFYGHLLGLQRDAYDTLRNARLSGSLERDLDIVRPCASAMLSAIRTIAPAMLAEDINEIVTGGDSAIDQLLLEWWRTLAANQFFGKVILQPYAQRLAELSQRPLDRELYVTEYRCPFCAGPPQLSILQGGGELEGGGRALLCATCFTTWPFRRVRCASCGEEDEHRLAYFHSPALDHLRVDACDTCRHYLKTIDLTRLGVAVPLVDEVAGAPLDVWARERGYEKIEINLVGL
jgi:formate dehydrogenase accessory protein FdhE